MKMVRMLNPTNNQFLKNKKILIILESSLNDK